MERVSFFPSVESSTELSDLICRAAWHLNYLTGHEFIIYSKSKNLSLDDVFLKDGFSNEVSNNIEGFKKKVKLIYAENERTKENVQTADAILKWQEDDVQLNTFLKENAKCTIYRTDPNRVRQEGSFYIQCAFDSLTNKPSLIEECEFKFAKFAENLGKFDKSWVLATGPSVDEYKNHDFTDCLTVACNSTVLDDDLVNKCKPKILVFADPIFHFGVSEYAGEFRKVVVQRLQTTDITIIVPFKYYALLLSIFPNYSDRIIGVPFNHEIDFNLDISQSFIVKTTSNILTLLLLPVASTFSRSINILGCDGRSFDEDDYFWGHGKTVQINSKMQNIQDVHPGFFKIDYNEYYFEHCHTLECLMQSGESIGKKYMHHANSFIPALRDRNPKFKVQYNCVKKHCLLAEPDGIGMAGHYVPWHNQVINELQKRENKVTVLCNKKQDNSLYACQAKNVFTSHSWGISRGDWCFKKGFEEHSSFKIFFTELGTAVKSYCSEANAQEITLFMYYGSVQILFGMHLLKTELKQHNIKLNVSICLFHESVILDNAIKVPRLPPNARKILLEGLAQVDSYSIASVTGRLKDYLYEKLAVVTAVMPNPIPSGSSYTRLHKKSVDSPKFKVVFPCALRQEKGGNLVKKLLEDILSGEVETADYKFYVRKVEGIELDGVDKISWINDDMLDDEYMQFLMSADVIVIPYLAPQFTYRTSGIIVDAIYAKKPILALNGTWLADVVKQYHTGLTITPYSSNSFISAIKVMKSNVKILSKYTSISFEKYEKENSWSYLVNVMFDR